MTALREVMLAGANLGGRASARAEMTSNLPSPLDGRPAPLRRMPWPDGPEQFLVPTGSLAPALGPRTDQPESGRTWAVEGAGGLGHLLAQQLVAAGERVLDVQPKLAARVRLPQAGDTNKNDPMMPCPSRSRRCAPGHSGWWRPRIMPPCSRYGPSGTVTCPGPQSGRLPTPCVLCELVPDGFGKEISAGQAALVLDRVTPADVIAQARCELAGQFLDDLRNLDAQLRETKKKLAEAVRRAGPPIPGSSASGPSSLAP
jgi:transposase